jgi:hypothetical protein
VAPRLVYKPQIMVGESCLRTERNTYLDRQKSTSLGCPTGSGRIPRISISAGETHPIGVLHLTPMIGYTPVAAPVESFLIARNPHFPNSRPAVSPVMPHRRPIFIIVPLNEPKTPCTHPRPRSSAQSAPEWGTVAEWNHARHTARKADTSSCESGVRTRLPRARS